MERRGFFLCRGLGEVTLDGDGRGRRTWAIRVGVYISGEQSTLTFWTFATGVSSRSVNPATLDGGRSFISGDWVAMRMRLDLGFLLDTGEGWKTLSLRSPSTVRRTGVAVGS
jgi:hypothetical protein